VRTKAAVKTTKPPAAAAAAAAGISHGVELAPTSRGGKFSFQLTFASGEAVGLVSKKVAFSPTSEAGNACSPRTSTATAGDTRCNDVPTHAMRGAPKSLASVGAAVPESKVVTSETRLSLHSWLVSSKNARSIAQSGPGAVAASRRSRAALSGMLARGLGLLLEVCPASVTSAAVQRAAAETPVSMNAATDTYV
jgi:hypothetical protein